MREQNCNADNFVDNDTPATSSVVGEGAEGLLPASEMIDRELVDLAMESHTRAALNPDVRELRDRDNECRAELLKRLTRPASSAVESVPDWVAAECAEAEARLIPLSAVEGLVEALVKIMGGYGEPVSADIARAALKELK